MARLNRLWMSYSGGVHLSGTIQKTMRARLVSLVLCVFALFAPALAADRRGGPSLDRVLPQIRHSVPGTFYDAEGPFLSPDGQATYRIKWMTPDGRIIWFAVDARSGQILGSAPYSGARAPYRRDEEPPPRNNYRPDDRQPRYGDQDNSWGRRDDNDDRRYGRGRDDNRDNNRDNNPDNNQGGHGRNNGHGRRPNG